MRSLERYNSVLYVIDKEVLVYIDSTVDFIASLAVLHASSTNKYTHTQSAYKPNPKIAEIVGLQ